MTEEMVGRLRGELRTRKVQARLRWLRAVGGEFRARIMIVLCAEPKGLFVGDLSRVFDASHSRVSHQLHILRRAGVVRSVREGRRVRYVARSKDPALAAFFSRPS